MLGLEIIKMQETRHFNKDGHEQRLIEIFTEPHGDNSKLFEKMNRRLFELEQEGHVLVQQKQISFSEKLALERTKKAKKKLNRMKKAVIS